MLLNISLALQLFENYAKKNEVNLSPTSLYDPRNYIMGMPGKKMRALLTLFGCDIFGEDIEKALVPALCVELFHNFSLVHDDIMDAAPTRRGLPSVHIKYDTNTAIISGDVMLIEVYDRLSKMEAPLHIEMIRYFNQTAREVCEGQALDMSFESRDQVSMPEYLHMIEQKTAVLLGLALRLGGMAAGAKEKDHEHLYQFAKNAGISFQLQDDFLDVYGDPKKFGKQVGGDIIQSKKSYFYVKAIELLSGESKNDFIALYANKDLSAEAKIEKVQQVFDQLYLSHYCQEAKQSFFDLAKSHLDAVSIAEDKREGLILFAETLMNRES
jgi:geranylgeranyl diphosphate synthase type II